MPAPEANQPTKKHRGKANFRPHPENLKRGGKKPREFLNQMELDTLNYILDGASYADAARWAGKTGNNLSQWVWGLLQLPIAKETLKDLQEKRKYLSIETTQRRRSETAEFCHKELVHRTRKAKKHEDVARYLRLGFLASGEIQPAGPVSATATATANATTNLELTPSIDIYEPLWLRTREAELKAAVEKRYIMPRPIPGHDQLTEDYAALYLQLSGGDKDRAREWARLDGWKF